MRVLVTEQIPGESGGTRDAEAELTAAGHEVARCRPEGDTSFACDGMAGRPGCPLERAAVDVALSVRSHPGPETRDEDGIRCAMRHHIPLVIAGATDGAPWSAMATVAAEKGESLASAVERASARPLLQHGAVASAALMKSMETAGIAPGDSSAAAHRVGSRIRVQLQPEEPLTPRLAQAAAVRVAAAVRGVDRTATGIDVLVGECRQDPARL